MKSFQMVILVGCLIFALLCGKVFANDIYVVEPGDTLSLIAQRILGDVNKWPYIYNLNKSVIGDNPNFIFPGQKLKLVKPKPPPPPPPMPREVKIEQLAKFMFKKAGLEFEERSFLEASITSIQYSLYKDKLSNLADQRKLLLRLNTRTKQYEIWLLAETIVDLSSDTTSFYKLVALVWQESHFINRRGKHGEVSFYQFLPSTVKMWYKLDDIGLQIKLQELENNPKSATVLAIDYMIKWEWNWTSWNGSEEYGQYVNDKIARFKYEWMKIKHEWEKKVDSEAEHGKGQWAVQHKAKVR